MKFEDILARVGDEGRFQFWLMALVLIPTSVFNALFDSTHMITSTPSFRCDVPELESVPESLLPYISPEPYPNTTHQKSCFRYDLPFQKLGSQFSNSTNEMLSRMNVSSLQNTEIIPCNKWAYSKELYSETATTYFDFVCDKEWIKMYLLQVNIAGVPIMTPLIGLLSDKYGRRYTLLVVFILAELSCLTPLLVKTVPLLFLTRFFAGAVLNAYYQLPFVLTQEMVSARYRTRASCLSALFYSVGAVLMPFAFKWTADWVGLTWITFFVTLPYIIFYRYIPESPFWLISSGKFQQAYDQLESIAKANGKPVPETLMADIIELENDSKPADKEAGINNSDGSPEVRSDNLFDLFLMPGLRFKTFGMTVVFIACVVSYVGMNSLTMTEEAEVQSNIIIFLAILDIPALFLAWWLVDSRLGRRWADCLGLFTCGICLLIPAIFQIQSLNDPIAKGSLYVGRFGIAGVYMIVYQHASELFPTTLRNQGIGICATLGALFGIFSSYFLKLAQYGAWLPLLVISLVCLFAAFVASFLPETLNEFLPERATDAAEFGKHQKYWSLAVLPKKKKGEEGKVESNGTNGTNGMNGHSEKPAL